MTIQRWVKLPATGFVLVSTDLHGNGKDFRRLRDIFLSLPDDTHWVNLGDGIHGPGPMAREMISDLYDYDDESLMIVEETLKLQEAYPGRIHYVLGNHDYGHVGGDHTSKFFADEVEQLEKAIGESGAQMLRALFEKAPLMVVAPCGAMMSHGAPDDTLKHIDDLNRITYPPDDPYLQQVMEGFMSFYGQYKDIMARLLIRLSENTGLTLTFNIHGHDKDEAGIFTEGGNQICPVIFGAPDVNKRYLLLDLSKRYEKLRDLKEGQEILHLYGD